MNQDRIKQMAEQAGLLPCHEVYEEDLAKFAALVAEDCAGLCDEYQDPSDGAVMANAIRYRYCADDTKGKQ